MISWCLHPNPWGDRFPRWHFTMERCGMRGMVWKFPEKKERQQLSLLSHALKISFPGYFEERPKSHDHQTHNPILCGGSHYDGACASFKFLPILSYYYVPTFTSNSWPCKAFKLGRHHRSFDIFKSSNGDVGKHSKMTCRRNDVMASFTTLEVSNKILPQTMATGGLDAFKVFFVSSWKRILIPQFITWSLGESVVHSSDCVKGRPFL